MKYGIGYVGSKNKIAKDILNVLPTGKRLVDLFGGGGAITHCASIEYPDKWRSILYNDKNTLVSNIFKDITEGTLNIPKEFITREKFEELKDSNGVIACSYSFGNDMRTYLYSKEKEKIKNAMHDYIVFNRGNDFGIPLENTDVNKRRLEFQRKYKKKYNSRLGELNHLERFVHLERLEHLEGLKKIDRGILKVVNIDYKDYEYKKGDIVYCDIPYETTTSKKYKGSFNNEDFYRWANEQPFDVYVSNYQSELAEKYGGKKIWEKSVKTTMSASSNNLKRKEILYFF